MSADVALYKKLETHPDVQTVYNYTDERNNPKRPYVVIKEESDVALSVIGTGLFQFRVFIHMQPGQKNKMTDYLISLKDFLNEPIRYPDEPGGKYYKFDFRQGMGSFAKADDGTITRERLLVGATW